MTPIEKENPCEVVLRTINTMSINESVQAGLEALVNATDFEQGKICLIQKSHLETSYHFSAAAEREKPGISSIPSQECAQLIMLTMTVASSPNSIIELNYSAANQSDWKPLIRLCGEGYAATVPMILRFQGTMLGFLVLQSRAERKLTFAEQKLFSMTADVLSLVLYHAKATSELYRRLDVLESAHPGSSEADKVWEGWLNDAKTPPETCPDCEAVREKLRSDAL